MVGRSVDQKDETQAYIKARFKLDCSLKKLMTELSTAFVPSCVSYDTVRLWKKKEVLAIRRIFYLVDMITKTKFQIALLFYFTFISLNYSSNAFLKVWSQRNPSIKT